MGKLYFYYGTMGAGKTALAINKAYEFMNHSQPTLVCLPSIIKKDKLESRNGYCIDVDLIIDFENLEESKKFLERFNTVETPIFIIDEAQFLTSLQVKTLRKLSDTKNTLVFCFGLLTDFQLNLFQGSKSLIIYANSFREIPSMCEMKYCQKKAQCNLRTNHESNQIVLNKDKYTSLCLECYEKATNY